MVISEGDKTCGEKKNWERKKHKGGPTSASIATIDDSTPVSQSRHTLRFQPIACRSIMRCPRVLTRPEMVWQAFVQVISWQCSTWQKKKRKRKEKKKKKTQDNGIVAMASVNQMNDTLSNVQVSHSSRFRSQKQGWKIVKLGSRLWSTPWSTKPERDNKELLRVFQDMSALVQNVSSS